jgi:uracil-DNA glycosylase
MNGLSKPVNRATSLRNFIKMLLHAQGLLNPPFQAQDICLLSKLNMVTTLDQLFANFLSKGFLLLNASLVWSDDKPVSYHARHWYPFNAFILQSLAKTNIECFLLFGKIAQKFDFLPREKVLIAEHPYVLSFIENPDVLRFFKPLNLLRAHNE